MLCPRCGASVHRSHTRSWREKLAKTFTRYKAYRCHHCGWRGLLAGPKTKSATSYDLKLILWGWLAAIVLVLIIVRFVINFSSAPSPEP